LVTGCAAVDVRRLAGDDTNGRQNDTPGSAKARAYLLEQLKPIAEGLNGGGTADAAYLQAFSGGTNVLAVIPGTDLADKYVMVGAHYDHLGNSCRTSVPSDTICNGATDNATGVAAALAVGRAIAARSTPPRRSVILAFWDREEDGLLGSQFYTQNPVVPLADTVGYVNFDIQGANLLPSLRNTTFAVGAESGGARLKNIVRTAADAGTLDTSMFSSVFGQFRSDYINFINVSVPTVFFSDSTGPCYHTAQDEPRIVDYGKLDKQIGTALAVTRELANTGSPPSFASGQPLATFQDLVTFTAVVDRGLPDVGRFSQADQDTYNRIRNEVHALVADGEAAFGSDDVNKLLGDAIAAVNLLTHGNCNGFLASSGGSG
jgi:Zn-dependent M28 family amino/carboxypeptidase